MLLEVQCPGCSKPFKVDGKFTGRRTNCPSCQAAFTILRSPPAAFEGNDFSQLAALENAAAVTQRPPHVATEKMVDDESRIAQFVGHAVEPDVSLPKDQLAKIRIGLRLHYIAAVLCLVANLLGSIGVAGAMLGTGVVMTVESGSAADPASRVLGGGLALAILSVAAIALLVAFGLAWIAPIADLVGNLFCLFLPTELHCRSWILASLIWRFVHPIIFGGLCYFAISWEEPLMALVGFVISTLGAWLLFMTGLQRFAQFLKRSDLQDAAEQIMGLGAALVLVATLIPGIAIWLLTAGHWQWWAVLLFCGGLISYWLFRSNPLAFLTNVFWFGTGIGFLVEYSNFLSSLHHVRVKVR